MKAYDEVCSHSVFGINSFAAHSDMLWYIVATFHPDPWTCFSERLVYAFQCPSVFI